VLSDFDSGVGARPLLHAVRRGGGGVRWRVPRLEATFFVIVYTPVKH